MKTSIFEWTKQWAIQKGIALISESQMDSTNNVAKNSGALQKPSIELVLADEQTHGRGRGSNFWQNAESGHALYSSWCVKMAAPPQHLTGPLVGLALLRSVTEVWPKLGWSLKAPNDLYLNEYKVAGLLAEVISQGPNHRLIVGLGMNVFSAPTTVSEANFINSDEGLGGSLEHSEWISFLDAFYRQLGEVQDTSTHSQLNEKQRDELLTALNRNPLRQHVFIEVSESGSLVTDDETIPWQSL